MTAVLKLFWGICLLRSGPETVPTHTWFLCALMAGHLALAMLLRSLVAPEVGHALALNIALIHLAVTAGIIWFALFVRRFEARFSATLGAVLGTGLLIHAMYLVGYQITGGAFRDGLSWASFMWSLVVGGFILHRALSCKLWAGILLSLAASLVGLVVAQAALGPALRAALSVASS